MLLFCVCITLKFMNTNTGPSIACLLSSKIMGYYQIFMCNIFPALSYPVVSGRPEHCIK